ncbi:hypothetical protein [Blastopirellula marina]|uniref:Pilus assembly protein PilM n=1 Tax=Blastopirellula marina TaxID=124 RepID=A0A2S8GDE8_9BACT|nr:hypothetical protein [Blastopirellula marina]PQO42485.1 hypothetical protein C5Y93_29610 [Blastopirellula marina]
MAKKLAIEWDSQTLRMVVARQRGSSINVEQALVVPLSAAGDDVESVEGRVGRLLKEQVASHGFNKLPAIIGVNRSSIELQIFSVPPVPDEELPDIVRYQAIRECANVGDDGVVDFLRLPMNEAGQSRVHAAAMSAKQFKTHRKLCDAAQLQPQSFFIRSFGAARLAASQSGLSGKTFLLVENLADRAELTVIHQNEVVLTRSAKLPGELGSEHFVQSLQGEVRRTMFAAQSKDASVSCSEIVILGQPVAESAWKAFAQELGMPVQFLNPLSAEHITSNVELPPESAAQLGGLIGLLWADSTGTDASIDFLNPRKRPDPPDRRRTYVLGATAAACVVGMVAYMIWSGISTRDARIEQLKGEIAKIQKSNEPLLKVEEQIIEIDNWAKADVNWLDELYHLSEKMPSADEAIIERIQMNPNRSNPGGVITLTGQVSSDDVIAPMERSIQDEFHRVQRLEAKDVGLKGPYNWSYSGVITIVPEERERFPARDTVAPQEPKSEESSTDQQTLASEEANSTEEKSAEPETDAPAASVPPQDQAPGQTEAVSTKTQPIEASNRQDPS